MPAQSSRSIGFLMLVGSSLTLCGLICNNNAMLSPSLLRYYPSKSKFRFAVNPPPPQPAQGRTHFPPFKGGFEVDETSSPPLQ